MVTEGTDQHEGARSRRFRPYPEYKDSGVAWPGAIPAHWEAKALKRPFRVVNGSTPKSGESDNWDGEIPWVTPEDLGKMNCRVLNKPARFLTRKGYQSCGTQLVPAGSLVLSTRAPIGHLAIAGTSVCTNQGCRSLVFRHSDDNTYFYFQLHAARPVLQAVGRGSTFKELASEDLESVHLSIPPPDEQRTIANFLDHETAKIDALVARKERLIELLQEKRTALITRAVTRGLDPNVPMKDSGFEWLGEIPAHWEVCRLRRVVSKFVDYRGKTPEKSPSGARLVTAKNVKNLSIDFSLSEEFIPEDLYPQWMVRGRPERGDVLITTEAPLGETAQILDAGIALAQRIILLKVNTTRITNDYLKYHFAADPGRMELCTRATGSTALGIKASHLKASLVAVPPVCEQEQISRTVDSGTAGVDLLIAKVRQAIDHLKEFRTALISAAVTGKIDVRATSAETSAGRGGTR